MKRPRVRWALFALSAAGAACRPGGDAPTDARPGEDATFDLPSLDRAFDDVRSAVDGPEAARIEDATADATLDRAPAVCDALPPASDRGADGAASDCGCAPEANARVSCVAGDCASACEPGFARCAGACVREDAARCGAACQRCVAPPSATVGCVDGRCVVACNPGYNLWEGRCSSFLSTRLAPESRGGHHASLAVGERGATHVLYAVTQDAAYTYAVHDGCRWRFERIAGVRTGYPFEQVRLRLGAGDVPHALASPVDGIRGIAYGRRRADGWIFEAVPTAGEPGEVGDMALDADGQAHLCLSFRAPTAETSYAYAVRRGDRWVTQEVARDREPPRGCAIEVDRGGRAHIVWSVERAAGSVRYMAGDAGGFTTRIIDPRRVDGGAGAPVSLALDPAGRPWIFRQVAGQGLSYDTRDDAGWSSGVVAADAYLPSGVSASFDGRGQPTVAARVGERVVTFHRAGTGWTRSDVSAGGIGTYVALATAPDGSLRAATSSASTTSGGVRVGRFDGGAWNLELVDPAVSTFGPATLRQGADGLSSVHVESGTNGVAGAHLVVMDRSPSGGWTRSSPWPDEGVRTFDAAVDARGALHVAWLLERRVLRYARREGGGWRSVTVPRPFLDGRLSLAVDGLGLPRVVFTLAGAGAPVLVETDGAAWRYTDLPLAGALEARILVGRDDATHVLWQSATTGIMHTTRGGGTWVTTAVDGAGATIYEALVDRSGRLRVCYASRSRELRLATLDGAWAHEPIALPAAPANQCALAEGPDGRWWIAYSEGSTDDTAAIRLGLREPSGWVHSTVAEGRAGLSLDLLVDAASRPHLAYHGDSFSVYSNGAALTYVTR